MHGAFRITLFGLLGILVAAWTASTPLTPASALVRDHARIATFDWIDANEEHLIDSQGRLVILRGFVTTPHGRGVRYDYTIDDYRRMRAMGANYQCIRLTMGALGAWIGRQPDPGYMAQIDSMVAFAKQVGMYSSFKLTTYDLPDFEETGWSALWENKRGEQEAIINGWKVLWERYKDEPAVVGYDLLNEPHAGILPLSDEELATRFLIPFYQKMIDAMQKIDGRHLAFFQPIAPPPRTGSLSFEGARIHRARIVYAPHFYPPVRMTPASANSSLEEYETMIQGFLAEARFQRAPLLIGEYGMPWPTSRDGDAFWEALAQRFEQAANDVLDRYGLSASRPHYADDRAGGITVDGSFLTWALIRGTSGLSGPERAFLTDVIARPYPARLAGNLETFGFNRVYHQFTLKYVPIARQGATEVIIPRARVFPNGFTITHSAGITLALDTTQPSGLRVVSNTGRINANAFSWNESSQTLTVQEWLTGASVTLQIR